MLTRKLWRDLRSLAGQTAAIALVVIGGTAMMVMALSNYFALAETRERFYNEYRFADVFARLERAPSGLLARIASIPGVRAAESRVVGAARLELDGYREPVTAQLISLPAPQTSLNRLFLRHGRLPDPLRDDELVLGEAFAAAHDLGVGDQLVTVLNGRRQRLRIVGIGLSPETIYQIRPGDLLPDFERFAIAWMAREPLARAFDLDGAFNDVVVALDRDASEHDVIDRLDALLARYGALGAHGRDLQMSHRFLDGELGQLRTMTLLFSIIFLAVSAFLLNIVLGRLIGLQREQIAVLRAFGYSRWQVGAHYAQLALAMVGSGVVPGLAVGLWGGRGLANVYMAFYSFPYLEWSLRPSVLLLSVGFAALVAAIGTLAALRRAFRLAPAEAMRPEAPPVYRRSLLERIGLLRPAADTKRSGSVAGRVRGVLDSLFDPTARMLLRSLERRPWRTGLTVAGIGMACGVLVMSRFQAGAIEHMISVQFGLAQRDDLMVALVEATAGDSMHELAALPGVLAVEPFRSAAVILRHQHREYRSAIQGLGADGDLKRVLDSSLQPVTLPRHGLLLTDYLADMLHVVPGDLLDLEFIEGRRRTVRAPVAGTVNEFLGVGVYADRHYLNRLLGEGDSVSGAWLALDPLARDHLLDELHRRPRIASLTDRAAMVDSFRETMAEGILTFTLVASLLAGSIAIGVVYNSARITLSERSRELASLRVLGYTRREIRALLAGELLTLAFLALLPGAVLGYLMSAWLVRAFESDLYRIPLVIAPSGYAFAALLVLAATGLSLLLLRRRLDHLDLVAVLKSKE